ncbi:hypothetical protein [Primorskyibacter marinus]|uniref:hypothetical protein n=1 Tax=Primorskyibacter marinus TaxID=1977320 RepID=UPI000E305D5D|nr:hypothetical protein [Primorskyibacter marinus]
MSTQPAYKVRLGLITATVWNNDGFYSVDISRSYKNNEGQWQNTSSYSHSDLLNVAKCAERAEIWIGRKINAA